jgi:hypothetical protein
MKVYNSTYYHSEDIEAIVSATYNGLKKYIAALHPIHDVLVGYSGSGWVSTAAHTHCRSDGMGTNLRVRMPCRKYLNTSELQMLASSFGEQTLPQEVTNSMLECLCVSMENTLSWYVVREHQKEITSIGRQRLVLNELGTDQAIVRIMDKSNPAHRREALIHRKEARVAHLEGLARSWEAKANRYESWAKWDRKKAADYEAEAKEQKTKLQALKGE